MSVDSAKVVCVTPRQGSVQTDANPATKETCVHKVSQYTGIMSQRYVPGRQGISIGPGDHHL